MIPDNQLPVVLTDHGKKRFRERARLPARAALRAAYAALKDGRRPDQLPGHLRGKLERALIEHDREHQAFARVHRGLAFIFARGIDFGSGKPAALLVTVLPGYDPTLDPADTRVATDVTPDFKRRENRDAYFSRRFRP